MTSRRRAGRADRIAVALEGAASEGAPAEPRVRHPVDALVAEYETACRLAAAILADEDEEAEVLGVLAALAAVPPRRIPSGRERAWILRTLMTLVGASEEARRGAAAMRLPHDESLRREVPCAGGIAPGRSKDPGAVTDALQDLDVPTRAAVLLVVREGLTIETAAGVQGSSPRAFAERYARGIARLGPDVMEALIGA